MDLCFPDQLSSGCAKINNEQPNIPDPSSNDFAKILKGLSNTSRAVLLDKTSHPFLAHRPEVVAQLPRARTCTCMWCCSRSFVQCLQVRMQSVCRPTITRSLLGQDVLIEVVGIFSHALLESHLVQTLCLQLATPVVQPLELGVAAHARALAVVLLQFLSGCDEAGVTFDFRAALPRSAASLVV